jgi:hypothetical protein
MTGKEKRKFWATREKRSFLRRKGELFAGRKGCSINLLCLLKHLADRPKGQLDICANILQASHQEIRQASYMDG